MTHWIDVIGIGEDGLAGLSEPALAALERAEVIIGGNRHHDLAPDLKAERVRWPEPFSLMMERIEGYRGRRVALLVTGDPLWYSAGTRIAREYPLSEACFHPQLSAFQLACARMGWSVADTETLTVHGRPAEQIVPWFAPEARLAVLTSGIEDPGAIAGLLVDNGFGPSRLTVLAALGGPDEQRLSGIAEEWARDNPRDSVPPFHTLCIECQSAPGTVPVPRGPGLPDHVFETDGNFTKQELRAITVCALAPRRHALLWDVGTGCGTVAIEWMRSARDAQAIGIDRNAKRLDLAKGNARRLGAPRLRLVEGVAPDALSDLPDPDAVFVGGGLDPDLFEAAIARLRPCGRLVANAVTLEGESILAAQHRMRGGELTRISVARAARLGRSTGWRQFMPITQWRFSR